MVRRGKSPNLGGQNAPRHPNGNIDWKRVYNEFLSDIIRNQVAPNTTRGHLYNLISKNVLKKSDYGQLKDHLVEWRKDGIIDWDDIADGSGRGVVNDFDDYRSGEDIINGNLNWLRNADKYYRDNYLSNHFRWYGQPHYVEFQSEKHAVTGTVRVLVGKQFTRIVFNRGNSGWEGMRQVALRLRKEFYTIDLKTGKRMERGDVLNPLTGKLGSGVHLWYLGDKDKKGDHMDLEIEEQLKFFGVWDHIEFKRIAVTEPQISEYNLIPTGDKGEYQIDALNIANPYKFKELLLGYITPFFDVKIHKLLLRQNPIDIINKSVHTKIKFLSKKE